MALHEKEKRRLTGHYQPANCSMTVQMNVCSAGQGPASKPMRIESLRV